MKKRICNYLCHELGTAGGHLHHCTRTARYYIPGGKYQDGRYVCGIHLKMICPDVNPVDLKTGKEVNRQTLLSMGRIELVEEDFKKNKREKVWKRINKKLEKQAQLEESKEIKKYLRDYKGGF